MNHHQPDHHNRPKSPQGSQEPRHRSERHPLIGDHFINHLIQQAPDPVAAARITDAYGYHGTAMAAFLGLDDTDPYDTNIALDFLNCFHGRYDSMSDLIDETIEVQGWNEALNRMSVDYPGLDLVLSINRDAVADLIDMRFDVVDLGDLYVFEK